MKTFLAILFLAGAAWGETWQARHDHWRGGCAGRLTLDETHMAFDSDQEKDHSWKVSYLDAQQATVLETGEFRLLTYLDRKWRLGQDREHRLQVDDPQFPSRASAWLERRLDRRFVSGGRDVAGRPLWELPAKHLLRLSGTEGTLGVYEDRIVYRTGRLDDSRSWRLTDIDSISTSDPYQLTITTYERARSHYGNRKGFHFQLKQPLGEDRYNDLWRRVEQAKGFKIGALDESGAPALLPAVARVESNFNPGAFSPKGAGGMYQLLPSTARRFGLRVDGRTDDRLDPHRSSVAAGRYLNHLNVRYGDWKLALAAYNAGEGRVDDFVRRGRPLPPETVRYVSSVLSRFPGE